MDGRAIVHHIVRNAKKKVEEKRILQSLQYTVPLLKVSYKILPPKRFKTLTNTMGTKPLFNEWALENLQFQFSNYNIYVNLHLLPLSWSEIKITTVEFNVLYINLN